MPHARERHLTSEQVRLLREAPSGTNIAELARKFKVSPQTAASAKRGDTYKYLPMPSAALPAIRGDPEPLIICPICNNKFETVVQLDSHRTHTHPPPLHITTNGRTAVELKVRLDCIRDNCDAIERLLAEAI